MSYVYSAARVLAGIVIVYGTEEKAPAMLVYELADASLYLTVPDTSLNFCKIIHVEEAVTVNSVATECFK